jgi:hypothetical protein
MPAGGEPERSRGQFAPLAERSRRSFRRSSSRRTGWLKADRDFPGLAGVRVKLRASATTARIARSPSSSPGILNALLHIHETWQSS